MLATDFVNRCRSNYYMELLHEIAITESTGAVRNGGLEEMIWSHGPVYSNEPTAAYLPLWS